MSKYYPSLDKIIDIIHKSGGLAFIAHIYRYKDIENKDEALNNMIKEYDLDGAFSHDDDAATEALCAIDSLIGDIVCTYGESEEEILKKIQVMINIKNEGDY